MNANGHEILTIEGMTCAHCERVIERTLDKLSGVTRSRANTTKGIVSVDYDPATVDRLEIIDAIEGSGYTVTTNPRSRTWPFLLIGIVVFALYLLFEKTAGTTLLPSFGQETAAFGALFMIGLFTSLHCVGMCGGINLAQSVVYRADEKKSVARNVRPAIFYNVGRVISYTVIGTLVGALGSVLQLSGAGRGIVAIVSGVAMVVVGLSLINVIPWYRIPYPKRVRSAVDGLLAKAAGFKRIGPFVIGLANGFMPCGPLQAMQLAALGAGSALYGAMSMFAFSLGTVPLMFAVSSAGSLLSSRFTTNMMRVSGVLVIGMGLVITNRGLLLSGGPTLPFL